MTQALSSSNWRWSSAVHSNFGSGVFEGCGLPVGAGAAASLSVRCLALSEKFGTKFRT